MCDIHFQQCRSKRRRRRDDGFCKFEPRGKHRPTHVARRGNAGRHMRQGDFEQTSQRGSDDDVPQNRVADAARMQDSRRQDADEKNN